MQGLGKSGSLNDSGWWPDSVLRSPFYLVAVGGPGLLLAVVALLLLGKLF